ncbi:cadherin-like domain-containing protein [Algibacillus agarilyticus]|uniref:cadherin-like domain-containing protein n=1 Tax=Algibacillus agarilyticus TaxID=2234133 RepID=UPI000DD036CE|nr:cadherin-like domain-containing protein [Algibacillus agarilyticus]
MLLFKPPITTPTKTATAKAVLLAIGAVSIFSPAIAAVPYAAADTLYVPMNSTISIPFSVLTANDYDEDGDALTILMADDTTQGNSVTDSNESVIRFTPLDNFTGQASFTYTLSDGTDDGDYNLMNWGNVTLVIENTQRADQQHVPLPNSDYFTTPVNTSVTIPVSQIFANDFDADNDTLSIATLDDVEHGTFSHDPALGVITFIPQTDFNGIARFTYAVSDGTDGGDWGLMGFSSVEIAVGDVDLGNNDVCSVDAANTAPVASGDNLTTQVNTSLAIPFSTLLENDHDIDGDLLTVLLADDVSNGSFVFDRENQIIWFSPADDFMGEAQFTYTLSDGHDCGCFTHVDWAVATITVNENVDLPPNDIPEPIAPIDETPIDETPIDETPIEPEIPMPSGNIWPFSPDGLAVNCIQPERINLTWQDTAPAETPTESYVIRINGQFITETTSTHIILDNLVGSTDYTVNISGQTGSYIESNVSTDFNVTTPENYAPVASSNYFVFGHSLFTFDGGDLATPTLYTRAGNWLGMLALASGTKASGGGIFGQIPGHLAQSANTGVGYAYECNSDIYWDPDMDGTSFEQQSFDDVIFMPSNYEEPSRPVIDSLAPAAELVEFITENQPSADVFIYEHWPDSPLAIQSLGDDPISVINAAGFSEYNQYTAGDYHEWFVDYQDQVNAATPNTSIRMIPVGPIIADLLENETYMSDVVFTDMYGDSAPHGMENTYLLAALITYRVMFEANPDLTQFVIPATAVQIIPEIAENLPEIVNFIEQRLAYYNEHGVNVYH